MKAPWARRAAVTLSSLVLAGCGGGSPARPRVPNGGADPTASARCKVVKSAESPLVTEWPASEKANLEARIAEGGVAVAYNGCDMKVLSQCRVKGGYRFQPTTVSTDTVEILNEDDLYAKLPLGAAALEGELRNSGRLAVRTTVSGQFRLTDATPGDVPTDGECAGATHLVSGLSVGAFKMYAGGVASAGGGVSALGAGVGAKTSASEVVVREAGDPARCDASQTGPVNTGCQSPLQLFLWPLAPRALGPGQAPAGALPPGAVMANFISAEPQLTWQVLIDGAPVCNTPCSRPVDPRRPILLKSSWRGVEVSLAETQEQSVDVLAHDTRDGLFAGGVALGIAGVFATVGGAVAWPVGCSEDIKTGEKKSPAACTAGPFIVGGGVVLLASGYLVMASSGPYSELQPTSAGVDLTPLGVAYRAGGGARGLVGPGFAAGTF